MLAGLVGRSTDWLAKIETGRRKPPRIDMLAELSRIMRVPLGDLLGQTVLMEYEKQQDDVPAVRAFMSPRRLSRLLFGPETEEQLPIPVPTAVRVEHASNEQPVGRRARTGQHGRRVAFVSGGRQRRCGAESAGDDPPTCRHSSSTSPGPADCNGPVGPRRGTRG